MPNAGWFSGPACFLIAANIAKLLELVRKP
jgi:hypothetical protein